MPAKVTAGEWLGLQGPPPAALSVPMNQPQVRVSRPISGSHYQQKKDVSGKQRIDRLRWRVLLLAGEHGNVPLDTDGSEPSKHHLASSPRAVDSTKQHKEPFWSSSVRVQSAGIAPQSSANVTTPRGATVVPYTMKESVMGSSSTSLGASTSAHVAALASSTGNAGGQQNDIFGTLLGDASAHSAARQQRRHRCGQVIPVTAVFTRDKGVFLHDTLPAVASPEGDADGGHHASRAAADATPQPNASIPTGDSLKKPMTKVPAPPPPPVRDMQTIKRLIRLVQVETGENHFRTPLDSKVLQSLIPTATMHRGHAASRAGGSAGGSIHGASVTTDLSDKQNEQQTSSPKRRPKTAGGRLAPPLSPPRGGGLQTELPTAVVGTSVSGDLALHVRGGGSAVTEEKEETKAAYGGGQRTSAAATTQKQQEQQQREIPRPHSARVSRPLFSYQRMFDGYTTLEQRQGAQGPTFSHFSSAAIPVVGRR